LLANKKLSEEYGLHIENLRGEIIGTRNELEIFIQKFNDRNKR